MWHVTTVPTFAASTEVSSRFHFTRVLIGQQIGLVGWKPFWLGTVMMTVPKLVTSAEFVIDELNRREGCSIACMMDVSIVWSKVYLFLHAAWLDDKHSRLFFPVFPVFCARCTYMYHDFTYTIITRNVFQARMQPLARRVGAFAPDALGNNHDNEYFASHSLFLAVFIWIYARTPPCQISRHYRARRLLLERESQRKCQL